MTNKTIFVTGDTDWCSETCLTVFLDFCTNRNVKPLLFATHESAVLRRAAEDGRVSIGLHPNFLPGSTHGQTPTEVLDHLRKLYPDARSVRSHSFFGNSQVDAMFAKAGLRYDSNSLMVGETGLRPFRHWNGLVRAPVFWEDDIHWAQTEYGPHRALDTYAFDSGGLKIINVHPFNFAFNVGDARNYAQVKKFTASADIHTIRTCRNTDVGTADWTSWVLETHADRVMRNQSLEDALDSGWCP